jgi:hypothetical protein
MQERKDFFACREIGAPFLDKLFIGATGSFIQGVGTSVCIPTSCKSAFLLLTQ